MYFYIKLYPILDKYSKYMLIINIFNEVIKQMTFLIEYYSPLGILKLIVTYIDFL